MKNFIQYIKESAEDGKNGHWEDFVDEDTGEIVSMWVNDPTPEELAQKEKERKKDTKSYWEKIEQENKYRKQLNIDKIENDVWDIESQLKDLHDEFRELERDQEEEVGSLYVAGKEAEAEALAQKYGEKFNKNSEKQEILKKKLATAQKKLNDVENKFDEFCFKLWN